MTRGGLVPRALRRPAGVARAFMPDDSLEHQIETERRHVQRGEALVAKQRAIVKRLGREGNPKLIQSARSLLAAFETSLALARERLATLEQQRA
jgi:hypothetical protein